MAHGGSHENKKRRRLTVWNKRHKGRGRERTNRSKAERLLEVVQLWVGTAREWAAWSEGNDESCVSSGGGPENAVMVMRKRHAGCGLAAAAAAAAR